MADIRAMQSDLQRFAAMLMQMLQQQKYIKESNEAWLARQLKEYDAYEAMQGRLGIKRTKRDLLMDYVKRLGEGVKGLDRPELAMTPRAREAGLEEYIPGVTFPQPTVKREEAVVPSIDSMREMTRLQIPDETIADVIAKFSLAKGTEAGGEQLANLVKSMEAEKERKLRREEQALTGRGLGLRREELEYKKTGVEKVDKTVTKIDKARENRLDLMDKISEDTTVGFFQVSTKSEKNIIKHILSVNADIKRYKKSIKGYDDPDWKYAEAAKSIKEHGDTKADLMKILMGRELTPEEEKLRDNLKRFLDDRGLLLPILMEYF